MNFVARIVLNMESSLYHVKGMCVIEQLVGIMRAFMHPQTLDLLRYCVICNS